MSLWEKYNAAVGGRSDPRFKIQNSRRRMGITFPNGRQNSIADFTIQNGMNSGGEHDVRAVRATARVAGGH